MQSILIIEPSTSGLELLPTAKTMDLHVSVLSANRDERIIPEHYHQFIDNLIIVDTNDFEAIKDAVIPLHEKSALSAIIPGFEIFVEQAATLSKLIGVSGISLETAAALRNKNKMRNALRKQGVRTPRYAILDKAERTIEVANNIGFPSVIKPIDQSGSVHVSKVNNLDELIQAYESLSSDSWTEMGKGIGTVAIVEEYIAGEEFSAEGYVDQSGARIVSITKKILGAEPYFVEMGHIVPAKINIKTQEIIRSYVEDVIKALDICLGVFHCEVRIDDKGPVLMEIAGRLAGDRICNLLLLSSGINLYRIMILSHLGYAIPHKPVDFKQYAGIHFFSLMNKESYALIGGIDRIQEIPGFHEFKIFIEPGKQIPPLNSFMGRVAYCIFVANSYEELERILNEAKKSIIFL